MTITSMTATFGGLENATLTLKPGLNVLTLPNEGGKSTWCAFIRAMFYGVETRKGRETSEKNRFTPWSGKRMEGSLDLIWQGRSITLRRFQKGATPFGGFQAVYTGTEEPVPGLTADNVGRTILGFGREVFERTCFIGQGGMAFGPSAELEQRLAALAASGEEDVSYSATEATLRSWRNALRSNRANGSIPQAQAKREECSARLSRLTALENAVREANAQEEELLQRQTELQAHLNARVLQQKERRHQAYTAAQSKLAQEVSRELSFPLPRLLACAGCLLAVLLGALATPSPLFRILILLAGGLAMAFALTRYRRAVQARQNDIDTARRELAALEDWEPPPDDSSQLRQELDTLGRSLAALRTRRAQADGELRAVGDPDALREQLALLNGQIGDEEERYAALTAAMDALAAANAQLQQRFAPAVSALAGEILSKLTAGRYDSLTFTRSFEALAGMEGGTGKSAVLLSQGTADQSYLALRLAICLLALPDTDSAPILLDDALVTFDDQRLSLALGVLHDFAQSRQVLLLTCQSREQAALDRGGLH